jgi:hypothetical protein
MAETPSKETPNRARPLLLLFVQLLPPYLAKLARKLSRRQLGQLRSLLLPLLLQGTPNVTARKLRPASSSASSSAEIRSPDGGARWTVLLRRVVTALCSLPLLGTPT